MANYKLSGEADTDLDSILSHGIAHYGEDRADRYFDALIRQFESLVSNPYLYAKRTEITPAVRVCPVGVHLVIYTVDEAEDILIIRVRHGSEDWL